VVNDRLKALDLEFMKPDLFSFVRGMKIPGVPALRPVLSRRLQRSPFAWLGMLKTNGTPRTERRYADVESLPAVFTTAPVADSQRSFDPLFKTSARADRPKAAAPLSRPVRGW
jgi:hypothetical protein